MNKKRAECRKSLVGVSKEIKKKKKERRRKKEDRKGSLEESWGRGLVSVCRNNYRPASSLWIIYARVTPALLRLKKKKKANFHRRIGKPVPLVDQQKMELFVTRKHLPLWRSFSFAIEKYRTRATTWESLMGNIYIYFLFVLKLIRQKIDGDVNFLSFLFARIYPPFARNILIHNWSGWNQFFQLFFYAIGLIKTFETLESATFHGGGSLTMVWKAWRRINSILRLGSAVYDIGTQMIPLDHYSL